MTIPGTHYQGKGFGWRKNAAGIHLPSAHKLFATRDAQPPLERPSLLNFRGRRIDQGQAGSCVAFATARALELWQGANTSDAPVLPSPLELYYSGRREEWRGEDPSDLPPLTDTGTEPRLMMQALEAEGFVAWEDYPYSDDPVAINREPPPDIYTKAYSQRGLRWGVVADIGLARIERVSEAFTARMPVTFGMRVDRAFMDNHGARIVGIDSHRLIGGHMVCGLAVIDGDLMDQLRLVDARQGDLLFDNWWGQGDEWGTEDGFGVLSAELFGSLFIDDVTVFQAVPPLRRAA